MIPTWHKIVAHFPKNPRAIVQHLWTALLFVGGAIWFVILPYHAVVEKQLWFWGVVAFGLTLSFICAASELAFFIVCVKKDENKGYGDYDKRIRDLSDILDAAVTTGEDAKKRAADVKEQRTLQRLVPIGVNYTAQINPTLAVVTNVANMLVAVVSTAAIWDQPDVATVGRLCSWVSSLSQGSLWARVFQHLPPIRCVSPFGFGQAWLPFPVNVQIFQTALALTLILMIGEILPKQLAQTYPKALCCPRLYYFVGSIFGLGAGQSLGRFSEWITERVVSVAKALKRLRAKLRAKSSGVPKSSARGV